MTAVSPPRRILSVWLRRLATDRIERRSHARAETPLVVVARIKAACRIATLNDEAARLGLRAGMALADARARYPALASADAEPEADLHLLETIADWCDRYTPLTGLDAPDGLLLDVSGCAHLFGGEAALSRDLHERLSAQGFHVRVAIAPSAGGAWALARHGTTLLASHENIGDLLLPLPLAALRLAPEIVVALGESGLKHVRDIADLPRAPLAARFGSELIRRLDQAFAREEESIVPRLPLPSYMAERRFAEPIAREDDILGTIAHLAEELSRAMERHGEGARRLQAALFRADGKVQRIDVGTGEPMRDPHRLRRLFADRLAVLADECDPGFGFDVVRLCALSTARLDPMQTGLGRTDDDAELAHLIDRFSARFGAHRVLRLLPQDTHIPEYAVSAVAAQVAHARERRSSKATLLPSPRAAEQSGGEEGILRQRFDCSLSPRHDNEKQDSLIPIRPIRLFERPEPVEAIAEVPDGPPVRFRWRHVLHEVARAEGPERIAMEWWRDANGTALTRDYFRVESRQGMRVWLYRQGLYDRALAELPRWYVHGLFA